MHKHTIPLSGKGSVLRVSVYGDLSFVGDICRNDVSVRLTDSQGMEFCSDRYAGEIWFCEKSIGSNWKKDKLMLEVRNLSAFSPSCKNATYDYGWRAFEVN